MKDKRGLSVVIATVLMIVLVMASVAIIWGVVRSIIEDNTGKARDCYEVEFNEKVLINDDYTCYNSTDGGILVSINLLDVPIESLLISIASAGTSKGFELTNDVQNFADVKNYYPYNTSDVILPSENSGKTYIVWGFPSSPDLIQISPTVGGTQCKVTDKVTQIEDCNVFVGF